MKVKIGKYPKQKERKVKIKFINDDFYSLDHTLALIIAPALRKFKKHKAGIPSSCFSERHWDLCGKYPLTKAEKREMKREEAIAEKKWNDLLDAMIFSFENIVTEGPFEGTHEERIKYEERINYGLQCFGEYYRALWV